MIGGFLSSHPSVTFWQKSDVVCCSSAKQEFETPLFFFSLSLCSCCFNSWLPLLLFSLNMLHDCNKRKKINLFLTGVGHLLSDREVSKQNTRSSEMSTVTFIFLPFPFCCPDNPWTHAPVCSPGQEPAEYILVLSFFKGWEACQSVFSLSSVAVELHQDVCLLWS